MNLRLGSVIENKQSLLEVIEVRGRLCMKKTAKPGGESDVKAQVQMLSTLPDHLRLHYPELIDYELDTAPFWYSMSFCEYPTLRHLLFFTNADANVLKDRLNKVIRFLFYEHYDWKSQIADQAYFTDAYEQRMRSRLSRLKTYDPFLERVLLADSIDFNGRTLRSPLKALDRLKGNKNLLNALTPNLLVSIHGQMEFDHILIDELSNKFVLLDPRGIQQLGDTAYDVGKIWQSCGTQVDLLEDDLYEFEFHFRNDVFVVDDFKLTPSDRFSTCQIIYEAARVNIETIMADKRDDHLLMRSDFAEAVHLCSAGPYYYEGRQKLKRAIACYLLGAIAFDKFLANYVTSD